MMAKNDGEGVQSTSGNGAELELSEDKIIREIQREHFGRYGKEDWWGSDDEIWKPCQVPGYLISNKGRVKAKFRAVYNGKRMHTRKSSILSPHEDKRGNEEGERGEGNNYQFVRLSHKGKVRKYYVHQLVAYGFLGEKPKRSYTVDHINRVRSDNRPENVRWASRKDQNYNREVTTRRGERSNFSKLSEGDVKRIRRIYNRTEGEITYKRLGEKFGVSESTIQRIILRKSWTHL